jgi:hypothetical protein
MIKVLRVEGKRKGCVKGFRKMFLKDGLNFFIQNEFNALENLKFIMSKLTSYIVWNIFKPKKLLD